MENNQQFVNAGTLPNEKATEASWEETAWSDTRKSTQDNPGALPLPRTLEEKVQHLLFLVGLLVITMLGFYCLVTTLVVELLSRMYPAQFVTAALVRPASLYGANLCEVGLVVILLGGSHYRHRRKQWEAQKKGSGRGHGANNGSGTPRTGRRASPVR